MLKNLLMKAFLMGTVVSVVALAAPEAAAQGADARRKAKEAAKAKMQAAKAKAKAGAKANTQKIVKKKAAAAKAKAEEATAEMMKEKVVAENNTHAKHMGMIERLEQIATATSNDKLKATVARLKEKEGKRHKMAMPEAS